MKVVLLVNAAAAIFLASGSILGQLPPSATEPVYARQTAAFALGFATTLIIVSRRFKRDIWLLFIPISVVGFNLLDHFFEVTTSTHLEWFIPPIIIESIFFLTYATGYYSLRRQPKFVA